MVKRIEIINKKQKPRSSVVFDTFWRFAADRQNLFYQKLNGVHPPITNDPILKQYKFTNAYRASDRVSQYLIKEVIYKGDQSFREIFFRTLLFKTFNKIETWEYLQTELGTININSFSFAEYNNILSSAYKEGITLYSGAYIMASGKSYFGYERKFQNHLKLIKLMLKNDLPSKLTGAKSLKSIFDLFLEYPTIGKFLAYQYAIDINYCSDIKFSEMDFVMPGPGAKDGIRKCFIDYGDFTESDIIRYIAEIQELEFERLGIEFKNLFGRPLQLIDCQNLFCEVDKYSRVLHPEIFGLSKRTRIKQHYKPKEILFEYWYPPKWLINNKIAEHYGKREKRFHQSS